MIKLKVSIEEKQGTINANVDIETKDPTPGESGMSEAYMTEIVEITRRISEASKDYRLFKSDSEITTVSDIFDDVIERFFAKQVELVPPELRQAFLSRYKDFFIFGSCAIVEMEKEAVRQNPNNKEAAKAVILRLRSEAVISAKMRLPNANL